MMFFNLVLVIILALVIGTAAEEPDLLSALSHLPACPLTCIFGATGISRCALTDQKCMCNDAQLQAAVQTCILKTCTIKEALTTQNITSTACGAPVRSEQVPFRVMNISLIVLSSFSVLARMVYKLVYLRTEIWWDDYFIIATLVSGLPSVILNDIGTLPSGLGLDIWTLTFSQITNFVKYVYVTEVLYFANLMFLRLSLLFFFVRIFKLGRAKYFIYGTIVFNTLMGISCILAAIFQCKPIEHFWLLWTGEHQGRCINVNALGWSNASIGITLDVWTLSIPLFQVRRLQLPLKKKIAAGIMFSTGTFVTVVSILRLKSLTRVNSMNPTMDQLDSIRWSTIEVNVGIICACMPTLRMILIRIFPKLGGTRSGSGRYYVNHKFWSRSRSDPKTGVSWSSDQEKGTSKQIVQDVVILEGDAGVHGQARDRQDSSQKEDELELAPLPNCHYQRPGS